MAFKFFGVSVDWYFTLITHGQSLNFALIQSLAYLSWIKELNQGGQLFADSSYFGSSGMKLKNIRAKFEHSNHYHLRGFVHY